MNDYYSPYSPPTEGHGNFAFRPPVGAEAQRAARGAAIIMFVLGALAFVCAMLFFVLWMMPLNQMPPEQLQPVEDAASKAGLSLKEYLLAGGIVTLIPAAVFLVLALWVRGGRRGAIITAMVVDAIMLAFLGLTTLTAMFNRDAGGPGGAIMPAIIASVMIYLMKRLFIALQASRSVNVPSAQYWQQQMEPDGWYQAAPPSEPQDPNRHTDIR